MGRKTYDSIGRALPKRLNIVVSRQADLTIAVAPLSPRWKKPFNWPVNPHINQRTPHLRCSSLAVPKGGAAALPLRCLVLTGSNDFEADVFFPEWTAEWLGNLA